MNISWNTLRTSLPDSEAVLIERARGGDSKAFAWLYHKHCARLYRLCLRMTRDEGIAEDCVQETFFSAWRALERFEVRSTFSTWLHRIAINVALRQRRRHAKFATEPLDVDTIDARNWALDTPVEERDIARAVAKLPDGMCAVLVFAGIWGYSHQETSRMLGIPEGASKTQLHRARKRLEEQLSVQAA